MQKASTLIICVQVYFKSYGKLLTGANCKKCCPYAEGYEEIVVLDGGLLPLLRGQGRDDSGTGLSKVSTENCHLRTLVYPNTQTTYMNRVMYC